METKGLRKREREEKEQDTEAGRRGKGWRNGEEKRKAVNAKKRLEEGREIRRRWKQREEREEKA